MEALEIESQTDQAPLTSRRRCPTQGELTEAQYLFDDPDHWFDRVFACPINRFAQRGSELVGHLDLRDFHPQTAGLAGARSAAASWDDGDHGPWRCRAQ